MAGTEYVQGNVYLWEGHQQEDLVMIAFQYKAYRLTGTARKLPCLLNLEVEDLEAPRGKRVRPESIPPL